MMTISYCLMAVSLVGLPHDHDHEHDHANHGSADCSACFFSANHIGIESPSVDINNLNTCISIDSPTVFSFIPTTLENSIQSRAPPRISVNFL